MKNYFYQFRPFLVFLVKFFFTYFIFTVLYYFFIDYYNGKVDLITTNVAFLTEKISCFFGLNLQIEAELSQFKILYNQKYVARIIEGCNSVSLLILFVSFVFSFSGKLKQTLLFIFFGCGLIYIVNICRIILLSILLFHYPEQEHIFHGILFPLIIYGLVFILWILWVDKFSKYASKTVK